MSSGEHNYLRDVQYRFPDRLHARSILHKRYGRGDWFEWLASHIPLRAGSVVADVGCGSGSFWVNAPSSIPSNLRLKLYDLSAGMIASARTSTTALNRWHDIKAQIADAANLPLADNSVDTTLAVHMLYHLDDPAAGLVEMARITREGGAVAVVLNPAGTMNELSTLVDAALDRARGAMPQPFSSEQALALMKGLFAQVDLVRYDDELNVTDPVDLLGYLTSLPVAESPNAAEKLAAAVKRVFASGGTFRITKASDLLIARL